MTHIVDAKVRAATSTEDPASRLLTAGAGIQTADNGAGGAAVVALYTAHDYTYADETAREAATGFVAGDVGKVAFQESNGTYWTLTDDDPITWAAKTVEAGEGGGGTPASTVTDETTWGVTPAVGTSTNYARADHTHGTPADPTGSATGYLGTLISSTLVGAGGAANIDVTSIAAGYDYLEIIGQTRSDGAADYTLCYFNNDTTATNYRSVRHYAYNNTQGVDSGDSARLAACEQVSKQAGSFASFRAIIPNYSASVRLKNANSISTHYPDANSVIYAMQFTMTWESTTAINRITLKPDTGNFVENTRVVIVGWKNVT